jgi:hypothetical protein
VQLLDPLTHRGVSDVAVGGEDKDHDDDDDDAKIPTGVAILAPG